MLYGEWCAAGYPPGDFWRQTPAAYHAAIAGFSRRHAADQKFALLVARSQAIWGRCDPKRIPSPEAILKGGKASKPQPSDMAANARAWIAVLRAQKGRTDG